LRHCGCLLVAAVLRNSNSVGKQSALQTQPGLYCESDGLYYEGESRYGSADVKLIGAVEKNAMVTLDEFNNVRGGGSFIVHSIIPPVFL
jgi:hypothetical protein